MNYLLCRFGGIGDSLILTIIAKELKKREHTVEFATQDWQVPLFDNLICFDKVMPTRRIHGIDCIPNEYGWKAIDSIKPDYDIVIDYKMSIERNTLYGGLPYGAWTSSMNSNFVNWIDLSLAWANLNPKSVKDKIPEYKLKDGEKEWAQKLIGTVKPIIGLHTESSSLSRTWYHPEQLPGLLLKEYPHSTILMYLGDKKWQIIREGGGIVIENIEIRQAFALVSCTDLLVCSDSGFSHVAEALKVNHITTYTTVPAWTREQYYKHSYPIEPDVLCRPCFNLDRFCPENKKRAEQSLSDREKNIREDISSPDIDWAALSKKYDTIVPHLREERQAIEHKIQALSALTPDCVKAITPEIIVNKVKELL